VVDLNSNIEEACGVMEVLLIPICANEFVKGSIVMAIISAHFNVRFILNAAVLRMVLNMVLILGQSLEIRELNVKVVRLARIQFYNKVSFMNVSSVLFKAFFSSMMKDHLCS